ncbi:MAG: DUF2804 domain-containing protein [Anaerolinea sp.]|nr:DUF2804 domain-containing protein [Anaerolinea sp.]
MEEQYLLKGPGKLLNADGNLSQTGWATRQVLDCNLEDCHFYRLKFMQGMRIKVWDYYAVTTPTHFFSFTISDIGYLGMVFAYVIEFATGKYEEQTLSIPFASGVKIPRNSTSGESLYQGGGKNLRFDVDGSKRTLSVRWPGFGATTLNAELEFIVPAEHESMTIAIPIPGKRFYYNRKINCMPASGWVEYQGNRFEIQPETCLGNLDWGRGVWEYESFWVWASASGFLKDKRRIGLNLGFGFGDTSAATENCFVLEGKVHKLGGVKFAYNNKNFMAPWTMVSPDGRLDLVFTPFFERVAKTDLKILRSEVHQMFGRYNGSAVTDDGKKIEISGLIGWAEEHNARW